MAECMRDRCTQCGKPLKTCMQCYGRDKVLWGCTRTCSRNRRVSIISWIRLLHRQTDRENTFSRSKVHGNQPTKHNLRVKYIKFAISLGRTVPQIHQTPSQRYSWQWRKTIRTNITLYPSPSGNSVPVQVNSVRGIKFSWLPGLVMASAFWFTVVVYASEEWELRTWSSACTSCNRSSNVFLLMIISLSPYSKPTLMFFKNYVSPSALPEEALRAKGSF